jgi:alkanesulfonate monooxygenase SsuD/methylene tetrahydromethanopterin reductase-like flavin-dependent oxidoreductase (luciferase family)
LNLSQVSFDISGLDLEQARAVVNEFENEGVKSVWLTENSFNDAFVEVAAIFNSAKRIRFGTMVAGIFARSPMITSLATVALSNLSKGRFVLGLGTQTKNSVEYWYGKRFVKPLSQMYEFVQISRRLLDGEKVTYNGKHFTVRDLQLPPCSHPIKIFIAAIGPKMIQLAGQETDGVMGTFWTPKYIQDIVLPNLKIGAERSGRSLNDFEILCSYECFPTSESVTFEGIKPHLVSLATVPLFETIFRGAGYEDEYKSIGHAISSGSVQQALSKVTPEMARDLEIVGTKSQIKDRIAELKKAGLTEVVLHPYSGNIFYEHYPDQFPFDITKFNGKPIYEGSDSYMDLIRMLR